MAPPNREQIADISKETSDSVSVCVQIYVPPTTSVVLSQCMHTPWQVNLNNDTVYYSREGKQLRGTGLRTRLPRSLVPRRAVYTHNEGACILNVPSMCMEVPVRFPSNELDFVPSV